MAQSYARVAYIDSKGQTHQGAPILYTVTIPSTARNVSGAIEFVQFLYGPAGRGILESHGLLPVRILLGGDSRSVPPALRRFAQGTYEG